MRFLAVGSLLVVLFAVVALGQRQIPPGVRQADHAIDGANQSIESPSFPMRATVNSAAVKADAAQLQTLAATVHAQI